MRWTPEEIKSVAAMIAKKAKLLADFGRDFNKTYDIAKIGNAYQDHLQSRFSGMQVTNALAEMPHDKMPLPDEIAAYINPSAGKITEAQFIQAQKDHERNNFDPFGQAAATIRRYQDQQADPYFDRRPKFQPVEIAGPKDHNYPPASVKQYFTPSGQPLQPKNIPPTHRAGYRQKPQYEQNLETTAHLRGNRAEA